jgi:glycosyltransferase involved in cell wall biosynthesis
MRIAIDVHSIGGRSGNNETYFRGLLEGLAVVDDRENQYFLYATDPDALMEANFDREKFRVQPIWPANRYLRIPFVIPRQVRRDDLDVYHAQFLIPPGVRCRTVTTIFDIAFEHYPEFFPWYQRTWSKRLIRSSAQRADHIITSSEHSRQDLIKTYQIDPDRITVTPLAPRDSFYPRPKNEARKKIAFRYGIASEFVLYVGRLQGRKNLVRLIDAFAEAHGAGVPHKLVLAGGADSLFEPVMDRVRSRRLSEQVLLPGYIDEEDLPWLYSAADAFVYPSLYEGFGLPVLEAMACGVPVLTATGSALQEVAEGAAVLFDPKNVRSISRALIDVLTNENRRSELAKSGLERSAQYSYRATARSTVAVYEKVAGLERSCNVSPQAEYGTCR